jgi:preprotein translocase SecE subunit
VSWGLIVAAAVLVVAAVAMLVWRERVKAAALEFVQFLQEVRGEVLKITWPDKLQLRNATLVILGFVTFVALLIGAMDLILQWLVVTLPSKL